MIDSITRDMYRITMKIKTFRYIRFWILILIIVTCAVGFEEVYDDVFNDPLEGDHEAEILDKQIFQMFNSYRSPLLSQVMSDITALGSVSVLIILFVIMLSALKFFKDYRGLLYQSIIGLGVAVIPFTLKMLFQRERPLDLEHLTHATTYSFPSGHAFSATAIYIALAYYIAQYTKPIHQKVFFYLLGFVLIFLVSVSRIYLGVHYATDVLAGVYSGGIWVCSVTLAFEFNRIRR